MTKEELVRALNGDKECVILLVEYLNIIVNDFIKKYSKNYQWIKYLQEHDIKDAQSYVLDVLEKYRYLWEEKYSYDIVAKHAVMRFFLY